MIKAKRTRFYNVLAVSLGVASMSFDIYARWLSRSYLMPGHWLGDQGWITVGSQVGLFASLLLFVSVVVLILLKRFLFGALLFALLITVTNLPWPSEDPSFRYKAELPAYKHAIQTSTVFGDQHSEVVGWAAVDFLAMDELRDRQRNRRYL